MKKHWYIWLVFFLALGINAACTPKPAPISTPAPAAPTVKAPAPVAAPAPAGEDEAWAKVVAAAQKEGQLTLYVSSSFASGVGRTLAREFRDKYGIQAEMLISAGRTHVERIKVEHSMKRPIADVFQAGLSSLVEVMEVGLTDIVWQELPALREKDVFALPPVYSPGGEVLSFQISGFAPLINTNLVKPQDEPKSYYDFLDPKWKGKIILEDPRGGGGSGFPWWATMRYFGVLNDDYWRPFAAQVDLFGGSTAAMYPFVARGEYAVAAASGDSSVAPFIAEGAPLKMLEMKEGNYVQTINIGALKNIAHPNAAKVFINWMFTKEGQTIYAKAASLAPLRKDVPDFSIPGTVGRPQKPIFRTWEATDAIAKVHKEGIAAQFFGKK